MATKFVTVSIEIMHDKNLSPNQKFILAEIGQLSSLERGCIASNRHFSELIGITTTGVSKAINDLEEKGYIKIDNAQTKRNFGRVITIDSGKSAIDSGKSAIDSVQESKENKTINKTINTKNTKKESNYISKTDLEQIDNTRLNKNALTEWLEYKSFKYKKVGLTKLVNMLTKYTFDIQQEMIDNSIMNNYAGLFAPKNQFKQPQSNKRQNFDNLVDKVFGSPSNENIEDCEVIPHEYK